MLRKSESLYSRYAALLVNYSLGVRPGWQVVVATTVEAEPLARELSRLIGERGEGDAPERLRRDERRDDRDTAVEVRLEEAEVGAAEEDPGRPEPAQLRPGRQATRSGNGDEHPPEQRREGSGGRRRMCMQGADQVVADGEEDRCGPGIGEPATSQVCRPLALEG